MYYGYVTYGSLVTRSKNKKQLPDYKYIHIIVKNVTSILEAIEYQCNIDPMT